PFPFTDTKGDRRRQAVNSVRTAKVTTILGKLRPRAAAGVCTYCGYTIQQRASEHLRHCRPENPTREQPASNPQTFCNGTCERPQGVFEAHASQSNKTDSLRSLLQALSHAEVEPTEPRSPSRWRGHLAVP